MATEIISIIDPDGEGNYTSLYNWEAGQQRNLVSADEIAVAQCMSSGGTADTTSVTISGWTVDATRYIKVEAHSSSKHNGVWDNTKYRLVRSSVTTFIEIYQTDYTKIIGLQIKATGVTRTLYIRDSRYCHIEGNLFELSATTIEAITTLTSGYRINIINNIIYGGTSAGASIRLYAAWEARVYNNTVIRENGSGIRIESGCTDVRLKNNIVQGTGISAYNYVTLASYSSDTTHNLGQTTYVPNIGTSYASKTVVFQNASANNYKLSPSDVEAKDKGTSLASDSYYPFDNDIIGSLRPGGLDWDLGAFECQDDNRFKFLG